MNSMQLIMWPEALVYIYFSLLPYAPEQICLPHCIYMSHCTSAVVYIQTPHYCSHPSKINELKPKFTIVLQNVCQEELCPSNATNMAYDQITQHSFMEEVANANETYDIAPINNVVRSTVNMWQWCRTMRTTHENDNYAPAQLHILSWPLSYIIQIPAECWPKSSKVMWCLKPLQRRYGERQKWLNTLAMGLYSSKLKMLPTIQPSQKHLADQLYLLKCQYAWIY